MVTETDKDKCLVLFSGGQDSTTVLAWALENHAHVETVGFSYGQRHASELAARTRIREALQQGFAKWQLRLGADHLLELAALGQLSETALTRDMEIELAATGLPNTFVPGRNLLFFTYAAALAYRQGLTVLVGGMCETDYSGYPDCRDETLQNLAQTLSLGMGKTFLIETPLMWLSKAQTFELAENLGGRPLLEIILEHSRTCYRGDESMRHEWGYGCDACPACELRAKGYLEWRKRHLKPARPATG